MNTTQREWLRNNGISTSSAAVFHKGAYILFRLEGEWVLQFEAVTEMGMSVKTVSTHTALKEGLLALRNVDQVRVKIRKVSPTHLKALVAARNLY
jgi:hypothetical protein